MISRTLVIVLRPDGVREILPESSRPFRDLILAVQGRPGSAGVVATAERPRLLGRRARARGECWGFWRIEGWAETDPLPDPASDLSEE